MNILIINTAKEPLHYNEFVLPIERILSKEKTKVIHYLELKEKDLIKAKKIIISGTSLKDNNFLKDIEKFKFLKTIEKPVLGICAGMQIICLIFGGEQKKKKEIGFYKEDFKEEFLGLIGKQEVYHLHNNYVTLPKGFKKFTKSKIPQAIKRENLYGVLFHPEVRNKSVLKSFSKI
jgi:GMP synthase-like glutamine amidotransferase